MFTKLKSLKPVSRVGLLAATMVLAAGFMVSALPPKSASAMLIHSDNPCGPNYRLIGIYPIIVPYTGGDTKYGPLGTQTGSYNLYWNPYQMKNCGVAYANYRTINKTMWRSASISIADQPTQNAGWDSGRYHWYAGPVYTPRQRPHQCISFGADFGNLPGNGMWGYVGRYRVHCG